MALSPFYNWSEPDNTSLVKDGAQAMRTLGDAIDTTMATKAVASNPVINSSMQVWQRGTSIAMTTTAYLADRWQGYRSGGGATTSRQVTGDTTNLPFIQYCARVQRDSGNASTNTLNFTQSIESVNSIPFAGKSVTFSFYARRGANFSPTSNNLNVYLATGTGTDQNAITGFTGNSYIVNTTASLTTTWVRYTYTATVGATATQLAPYFAYSPTGTAGANDYFEITGVQVDIGSVALPFQTASGGSIQGELAMCQRYFQLWTGPQFSRAGFSYADSTTNGVFVDKLPVCLRSTPSLAVSNMTLNGNAITAASIPNFLSTSNTIWLQLTTSGVVTGTTYQVYTASGTTGVISYSSEL